MFQLLGNSYVSRFLCNLIAFMLLGLLGKYRKNEKKERNPQENNSGDLKKVERGRGGSKINSPDTLTRKSEMMWVFFFSFLLFLHSGSNSRTAVECVYDENTKSSQAYDQVTICKCSLYAYLDFHLFS